jgi:hypothetical protein
MFFFLNFQSSEEAIMLPEGLEASANNYIKIPGLQLLNFFSNNLLITKLSGARWQQTLTDLDSFRGKSQCVGSTWREASNWKKEKILPASWSHSIHHHQLWEALFMCQLQPLEWLEILSQGSKVRDYGRNHQNFPNDLVANILSPSTMHPTLSISQKVTNT